jgi:hypothetical protein
MHYVPATVLTLSVASFASQTVTINFDNLANNTVVSNQYPQATFSSEPGFDNVTTAQNLGTSLPNFLCTAVTAGGLTCTNDTYVDFSNPVYNLSFLATGDDDVGVTAQVDVHVNGSYAATVNVVTDGIPSQPDLVDLSAYSNVTRIEIYNITDFAGLGWDDFTFTVDFSVKYCTANANSTGVAADISASGSNSSGAGDLTLTSEPVPNQAGIFFHGQTAIQSPFGNGYLCVSQGLSRGTVVIGAGNTASYTYDNSGAKRDLSAYVGTVRRFQHWFRDPMGGGARFSTSNAIAVPITL